MRRDRAASLATAALLVVLGALLAASVARGAGVGDGDGAGTLVVARNLLAGRGFSVDFVASFLRSYPAVHHPEDSFPLLMPAILAGLARVTGDVMTASRDLGAALLFAYVAGLPLLVLRWYGPAPALALAAGLVAFESRASHFGEPLNDPGAQLAIGLAWLLVLRALEVAPPPEARRRLVLAALTLAVASQYKASTAFFGLAAVAAIGLLDARRPWKARVGRASFVGIAIAVAHVPVLAWFACAHGDLGLPQNAAGRTFVRAIAARDDFWQAWEGVRVYLPAHPDALLTIDRWIARDGAFEALVRAPLARVAVAFERGCWRGEVADLPIVLAVAIAATGPSRAARAALLAVAASLAIPIYSHYEARYFYPLRPILAVTCALALHDAAARIPWATRVWVERALPLGVAFLCLHQVEVAPRDALAGAGLLGAAAGLRVLAWRMRQGTSTAARARHDVASAALAVFFATAFAARLGAGVVRVTSIEPGRDAPDSEAGRWLASVTSPDDVVMARRVSQLSLFARRSVVMIPLATDDVCAAARAYGAASLLVTQADRDRDGALDVFAAGLDPRAESADRALYHLRCAP